MSDVLIMGMKIPKSCYNCTYLHWSNFWQVYVCCAVLWEGASVLINGNEVKSDIIIRSGRGDNCPLVEVPEHGRLIDADALLGQYNGNIFTAKTDYAEGLRDIIADVKNAPTIIPAVKENGNA